MFGWLSGKRHFRAHSCQSPGTWILPQKVQWWGAGRRRYAFYLRMASCERTWCETKTGCSDIRRLSCFLSFSSFPELHTVVVILPHHSFHLCLLSTIFCPFLYVSPLPSSLDFILSKKSHSVLAQSWINNCVSVAKASYWNAASHHPPHHGDRRPIGDHILTLNTSIIWSTTQYTDTYLEIVWHFSDKQLWKY